MRKIAFSKLPTRVSLNSNKCLSYTAFQDMRQCVLRGIIKRRCKYSDEQTIREDASNLISGDTFHKLLQNLPYYQNMADSEREDKLYSDIQRIAEEYCQKYKQQHEINKFKKLEKIYDTVIKKCESPVDSNDSLEQEIVHSNGYCRGTPDVVRRLEDHYMVIDYKSSDKKNEMDPRHRDQLHFYANLVEDSKKEFPRIGRVEYFYEEVHDISLDRDYSLALYREVKNISNNIEDLENRDSELVRLAEVSFENCNNCNVRHLCPAHFQNISVCKNENIPVIKLKYLGRDPEHNFEIIGGFKSTKLSSHRIHLNFSDDSFVDGQEYIFTDLKAITEFQVSETAVSKGYCLI